MQYRELEQKLVDVKLEQVNVYFVEEQERSRKEYVVVRSIISIIVILQYCNSEREVQLEKKNNQYRCYYIEKVRGA